MKPVAPLLQSVAPPTPVDDSALRRTVRFRLWELQDCWHCMIIGTCLTLTEVRQSARKAGFKVEALSDYETHRLAVERASNSNRGLTQRIQKLLDRKFDVQIKRFRSATNAAELKTAWQTAKRAGHIGGGLWALLTHPRVTADAVHQVFGEIHMMSHLAGARTCNDIGRLAAQDRRIEELEAALADARQKQLETTRSLAAQVQLLERSLHRSRSQLAAERERRRRVESSRDDPSGMNEDGTHTVLERVRQENVEYRDLLRNADAARRRLEDDNARLDRMLSHALLQTPDPRISGDIELCGRCVLYLGGKAQQCRHFQALVESRQGRFLHHDGGIEDSGQRISDLIHQADAVLCPTDCISHSAMRKARLLCEKQDKPMIFMPRASLSAFASSLDQVASKP